MDETEVKQRTEKWLEKQDCKLHREVAVLGTNREVIMDYYAYKESNKQPEIFWIECKGERELSEYLEGFIRTEFAMFYGGGTGILALCESAAEKLLKYKKFLKGSGVQILNVESYQLISLHK